MPPRRARILSDTFAHPLAYVLVSSCLRGGHSHGAGPECITVGGMPALALDRIVTTLNGAVPELQREFIIAGPLRNVLPADIRADIVRIFTQVLCRAVTAGDGAELSDFVESVVWESRKLGVVPALYMRWIDQYGDHIQALLGQGDWKMVEPMIERARRHIIRLGN